MFVTIFVVTNLKSEPPEELSRFIENTDNYFYWTVNATPNSIYIMIYYKNYYEFYSVGLFEENIIDYKKLKENLYKVNVNDSRIKNSVMSWRRFGGIDNPLSGPKRYETIPYTAYNVKDYYEPITNKLVISMKRISNYEKMEQSSIEGWVNYSASYNLKGAQGGLPISMEAYQGDLILMLDESSTKMNEIYISDGEWVYIRHVEKGEYPRIIDDGDLDSILENIWWGLENIIRPLESKLVN